MSAIQPLFRQQNAKYRISPTATTAYVLTTGPGIELYKPQPNTTTYGVNDIWGRHHVHHLVTLDNPWHTNYHPPLPAEYERRHIVTRSSKPAFWHYWKETHNQGIADQPGYTFTPLTQYTGKNLFAPVFCPKWYCSAFVACALAARHGHTTIITHGIHWYGHPVQEQMIASQSRGFKLLAAEMAEHGITLYTGNPASALAKFLPVWENK